MPKWLKSFIEFFTRGKAAEQRIASGVKACVDCEHRRGGTHGVEDYCLVCTSYDVVSGGQKFLACHSARLQDDKCGKSGKQWKLRRGLISCQG